MALSVICALTDIGRQRIAQQLLTGKSFRISQFSVNSAGHDPQNPLLELTPDVTADTCPGGTPLYGPVDISSSTLISAYCPQFECVIPEETAVGAISNLCLYGEIIFSPELDDPDLGTSFLFAIGNFPLKVKTSYDAMTLICNVQF